MFLIPKHLRKNTLPKSEKSNLRFFLPYPKNFTLFEEKENLPEKVQLNFQISKILTFGYQKSEQKSCKSDSETPKISACGGLTEEDTIQ